MKASSAAIGSSKKNGTKPEILLRKALWSSGLRYQINRENLPGIPDVVFIRAKIVIFVDGYFWHGKDWKKRKPKLEKGHNGAYWVAKIERNMERDLETRQILNKRGWKVLRFWESDLYKSLEKIIEKLKILAKKH